MHALNGNIEAIHERILLVREFNDAILYIMDSLKDASQNTIDSFFEIRENRFLIWILSESLLRKYGVHITDDERSIFYDALQRSFLSRQERNRVMHSLNGNRNLWTTRGQAEEEQGTIFADPRLLQHFMFIFEHINEATHILEACRILSHNERICYLSVERQRMFVWIIGGERALNHFGLFLSAEERNRFMHTLNSNGNDIKTSEMDRIPIMDGTNYTLWAYPMRAYLEFKGYWQITADGLPDLATRTEPFAYNPVSAGSTTAPTETWESKIRRQELKDKYHNLDDGAKGSMKQRLSNAIIEQIKEKETAQEVWTYLEHAFNKAGSAQVFGDIQKVYAFQIRGNQNPESEISKLALLFARLKAQGAELSKFYQAMTLLNAGSTKWPHLVSIYLAQKEMKKLDFDEIKVMFITDWHRTTTLGQSTPKVNKISGVQQKKKDPNWKKGKGKDNSKSETPTSPSSSNDSKSSSGRKFRGGRRTKKKVNSAIEETNEEEPSHILSFAASAMIPHYTSTVSTIDSRSAAPPQKYQGTPTKGAWETVPEAISLLHRMGIKPSIQTFTPELLPQEPITAPDPEVVVDWDDVVSLGEEPQETYTEAEIVDDSTTLIDESMDYLFEELIQDA
ncbi:hypothetical protein AMATHDRAFT_8388 [Amanita thiersii Skay4041]|uniref:Uncharacterized protein n=1 Tax=Amanita thiersii Skay4041 TaxID=703135 RepID=A0A2A9N9N4_9AGAR|nr:hypothetical protein AMATHDRAFT_8388 [Amanita thiersii Skay4041]